MLIPAHIIYFWIAFTSVATCILLIVARRVLETSPVKDAFLLCLGSYLFFSIPLLAVFLQMPTDPFIRFTSQMIHSGGILFVALLGRFILHIASPGETQSWRFRLFMLNYAFLFTASFLGLIENGVDLGPHGLAPIPGPLMPYFNLTMVAFTSYFLFICGRAYRKTTDELLLCQLRAIFWTALPAFSMLMVTNAIIPGITGDFQAAPAGAFWILLCFTGVGYILAHGKHLLIDQEIQHLVKIPNLQEDENRTQLRNFINTLCTVIKNPSQPSAKEFVFSGKNEKKSYISIDSGIEGLHSEKRSDSEARNWVNAIEDINVLSPINALLSYSVEQRAQMPLSKKKTIEEK